MLHSDLLQVQKAMEGGSKDLESLILMIQNPIFSFLLRVAGNIEEAQDTTQEVLVKIITNLSRFEGRSSFLTWSYKIAYNHFLDQKKSSKNKLTFSIFSEDLLSEQIDLTQIEKQRPEYQIEIEEVRIGCTLALLQCLDVKHRSAYIIGEILEIDHAEAAIILDMNSSSFRKQLERARKKIEDFTRSHCGIISPENPCHCSHRVNAAKSLKRIPNGLSTLAETHYTQESISKKIQELEVFRRTAAHYRALQSNTPTDFTEVIRNLLPSYLNK